MKEKAVEKILSPELLPELKQVFTDLETEAKLEISSEQNPRFLYKVQLKYQGSDSTLIIDFAKKIPIMKAEFEAAHQQRSGFTMAEKSLVVEAVSLELIQKMETLQEEETENYPSRKSATTAAIKITQIYTGGKWYDTPIYLRDDLQPGDKINSPALIIEKTGTNVVELGWQAELTDKNHLILTRNWTRETETELTAKSQSKNPRAPDPVMLEIFNNLFRAIAEQMGVTLQNTSSSVNIKERLDFSCAIFDKQGQLVANAPHILVHLGSMSESVNALISDKGDTFKPGDVYVSNNPYNGGTHLPDITVIAPVFIAGMPMFYVASRGHHADIGGMTPGSMPPHSQIIDEEGILIDNFQLVKNGKFQETELLKILISGKYPARNTSKNIADLQAQIAANETGVQELHKMVEDYGLEMVQAYMGFVQYNAEESVRRVFKKLSSSFTHKISTSILDDGNKIQVAVTLDKKNLSAKIDFTGTSAQLSSNFNAPAAVCKAAVLYVFRTLVDDDIPLNAGCLKR